MIVIPLHKRRKVSLPPSTQLNLYNELRYPRQRNFIYTLCPLLVISSATAKQLSLRENHEGLKDWINAEYDVAGLWDCAGQCLDAWPGFVQQQATV